jgi:hypothetical protein
MANPPTTPKHSTTARVLDATLVYQSVRGVELDEERNEYWEDAWMRHSPSSPIKHPHLTWEEVPEFDQPLAVPEF